MKRRFFLKSAAGLVLAAPFLPSLRGANAQMVPLPRRSVIFHSPCGCLTNRWFPKVEHGPLDANALAGTTLEVLTPFVRKLLVPRGLRGVNGYGHPQTIDPHDQAMGSKLTCSLLDPTSHYATSHSLDHAIAWQRNPGARNPLVVGPSSSDNVKFVLSYSATKAPLPAISSPQRVFDDLSGILMGATSEAERLRRRKKSVLDAVRDDLQVYQRFEMSRNDKRRIDAWLTLLRETERGLSGPSCDATRLGVDPTSVKAASQDTSVANAFTVGSEMMMRLMALSMLCDTNRSLVLTFPGYAMFKWDGIQHQYDHDALAHRTGSAAAGGTCLPGVLAMLAEIDRWYANKYAQLLQLLDGLPEGDGTLLDNTATVWLQEFSDGNAMNQNNLPIVIAGSAGGYLKQGVAVNVDGAPIGAGNSEASCADGGASQVSLNTGSTGGNVPINKLYVTLMNALGCTGQNGKAVTSFGTLDSDVPEAGITDPGELTALKA
ncbi:MAG: DUF1552 domain-containing protein [Myxococcota bacterium]